MSRKKRKKRLRSQRPPGRPFLGLASDEARFRLAARLSTGLGVALLAALALSYLVPPWRRALGPTGNLALRIAGVALIIVSMMFARLDKAK